MLNRWIRRAFHPHRYFLAAYVKYAAFVVGVVALGISKTLGGLLFWPMLVVGLASHFATIPALARDRHYLDLAESEWVPSRAYYVMFFLPIVIGPAAAVIYLYRRYKHIGLRDTPMHGMH